MSQMKTVTINGLTFKVPSDAEVSIGNEKYYDSVHVTCYRGVYQIIANQVVKGKVDFSMALGQQERVDIVNHSLDRSTSDVPTLESWIAAAEMLMAR